MKTKDHVHNRLESGLTPCSIKTLKRFRSWAINFRVGGYPGIKYEPWKPILMWFRSPLELGRIGLWLVLG
jgi:hypothetical protein